MLDLWTNSQDAAAAPQPQEAKDLPATFGEAFDAAWSEGEMFSQSVAHENARMEALGDHIDDIERKTGKNLGDAIDWSQAAMGFPVTADQMRQQVNVAAQKIGQPELSSDDLEAAAAARSKQAVADYQAMAQREKTFGGRFGMVAGGLSSAAADPVNLVAAPVAPEADLGILGTALTFGAYGVASQGVNEAANAQFRERVQPGYVKSGQPVANILEAGAGGAVLGGALKGAGNLWTRLKTGAWPQSVRDAGNVVESEANIAQSNVLPGLEGEATHRSALATATDQIVGTQPISLDHIFQPLDPEMLANTRALVGRLQSERPFTLPVINEQSIRLISEEAQLRERSGQIVGQLGNMPQGDLAAADRLNRLQAVEEQIASAPDAATRHALNDRRDQILVDTTPEALRAGAVPFEQRRSLSAEQDRIADRLNEIAKQREAMAPPEPAMTGQTSPAPRTIFDLHEGRIDSLMDMRSSALDMGGQAAAERAASQEAGELPFGQSMLDQMREGYVYSLGNGIKALALYAAHDMPLDEARALAERVVSSNTDEEARAILNEVPLRPRTLSDTVPSVAAIAKVMREAKTEKVPAILDALTPEAKQQVFNDAQHGIAFLTDLERLRDTATTRQMIPVGVDEKGEPQYRLLDEAIQDAKNDEEAATQLESCINPPMEEAAE